MHSLADETFGPERRVAVVAVGGYGRGVLSPHSDIDLLLLTGPRGDLDKESIRGLLYPLWDGGWQVGHAVRTPKDAIDHAAEDWTAATSLLSARLIAGHDHLFDELQGRKHNWLARRGRLLRRRIAEACLHRRRTLARAGWSLAPDIKEDVGGLRDLNYIQWAADIDDAVTVPEACSRAGGILLAAREALHAESPRKLDRIRIDLQPRVARRLALDDIDALMAEIHTAARTIEHEAALLAGELMTDSARGPRRSGRTREVADLVKLEDGVLRPDTTRKDPAVAVRLLTAHAELGRPLDSAALRWIEASFELGQALWSEETRKAFLELLAAPQAAAALEACDHAGALGALIPEWSGIRGRPQHDPYHQYTVDGHSFVAVSTLTEVVKHDDFASAVARDAGDLGCLYLATLLHDIGKGSGDDHSVAGSAAARAVCERMGLAATAADEVTTLIRHHLLLADTATRRDIDDGAVIADVADLIPTPRLLRLLYLLTIADGLATGPNAWSEWKATLVRDLYVKILIALETGELPTRSDVTERAREVEMYEPLLAGRVEDVLSTLPPSYLSATPVADMVDDIRMLLNRPEPGGVRTRIETAGDSAGSVVTICAPDRPGTLARSAGVLALNRVSVFSAQAYVTTTGLALTRFLVSRMEDSERIARLAHDLDAVFGGRIALEAHLQKKVTDYKPAVQMEPEVRVLQDASPHSTVIEVRAPDALGLLYAIAAGLADLDVDVHVAKIDTLGHRVVDVFYTRSLKGEKLSGQQGDEVARAIAHRVRRMFD